jgi:stearoyl-CoA desaturase (delta-9 desaturase)
MNNKQKLLLIQIYIHIAFFVGICIVPWNVSLPFVLISQIIYVGMCGTAFFHRTVSHKNKINPIVEKILILLSWIGASGSAIAWSGTHRKHHRFSDTDKDPHCPKHMGIIRAYWYSSGNDDIIRYVPDLLRNKWYLFQHLHYFQILLSVHVLGLLLLPLSLYWGLLIVPAFLMWFAGSSINVLCHTDLHSVNNKILGFIHAGEGWHKNHHDDPSNPSFKHWADWGGYLHRLMRIGSK